MWSTTLRTPGLVCVMYWSFAISENTKKSTKMENDRLFLMMRTSKIVVGKNESHAQQTKTNEMLKKLKFKVKKIKLLQN